MTVDKKQYIPYARQWIDEDDIRAVEEVLRSDYITTGPKIKEFEEKFAEYVGARYAAALSNGTAALHAACFAAGLGPEDEVITSPITFAASANCILFVGAKPVFADIDDNTYDIDPVEIEKNITQRTKAIIPVHFTGQPCDMDEIHRIAKKHKLIVIEDAAHALGAEYKGKRIGSLSDMTCFSFHPVKHITTGEGGMVTTDSEELYEKLVMFRTHGITRDKNKLINCDQGPWYYEQQYLGYNYRMTDIQAALGISQLKKLPFFLEKRREQAAYYNEAFKEINSIVLPYQANDRNSSWHIYVIRIRKESIKQRDRVFEVLQNDGIGVNVHYIPVYYHPYYQKNGYKMGICPKAESYFEEALTLPLFPKMGKDEQDYVIEKVIKCTAP